MYSTLLTNDGCVYSDNVLFKGLVANDHVENKRLEGIVKKLKEYNQSIMDKTDFITTIIPIGDGLAVSKKFESRKQDDISLNKNHFYITIA